MLWIPVRHALYLRQKSNLYKNGALHARACSFSPPHLHSRDEIGFQLHPKAPMGTDCEEKQHCYIWLAAYYMTCCWDGERQGDSQVLTSSLKFETTGGEALSQLLLSLKPNCLWVLRSGRWEMESCLQHTNFGCSDFCWLSTVQQPWGIGFPLGAGSAPSAGNGPV